MFVDFEEEFEINQNKKTKANRKWWRIIWFILDWKVEVSFILWCLCNTIVEIINKDQVFS